MSIRITKSGIRTIASGAKDEIVDGIVAHQGLLPEYGINTQKRVAHFLGQCACETGGFTLLEENLYYTTTKRLHQVWPSRFPTAGSAAPYLRNPRKLANKVYGGRLGNKKPDDGWKYRGSGLKNTTGLYNFSVVERETGLPVTQNPEMLRRFPEALISACIYWKTHNLNRFADVGDVTGLTKAVQGGTGGLKDRRIYTARAMRVDWHAGGGSLTPPAAPSGKSVPEFLREGDKGPEVRKIQQMLANRGYEINVDGDFGEGTDNIVRQFQEDHGLMVDGVVGPATRSELETMQPVPEPEPKPKEIPVSDASRGRQSAGAVNIISLILKIIVRLFNGQR